jgi:uncharacterized metal-binding protein
MNEQDDERSRKPVLIFACSGAADVGEIADGAARQMTQDGAGEMSCLAGIGARVQKILEQTEGARKILVIDGCSVDCAKQCLELVGLVDFEHLRVTDSGMEKGSSPVSKERIAEIAATGTELLA